jgi:hypothetical protein
MSRAHEKFGERVRTESQDIIANFGAFGKDRQNVNKDLLPRDGNAL